ncbi:MAG: pyridoxamine 5'-phosphate oxidase family protein [Candidatus Coproplasma sp.]
MRKSNREIKDFDKIIELLDRCQVIRLGLQSDDYPYIVPLSFGWEVTEGKLNIYFHCAKEGKKLDLMAACDRVCIEADILNGYKATERSVTADYESVIGFGTVKEVTGSEAVHGIKLLLDHCGIEGYSPENCALSGIVAVYKITVENITGKKRFI